MTLHFGQQLNMASFLLHHCMQCQLKGGFALDKTSGVVLLEYMSWPTEPNFLLLSERNTHSYLMPLRFIL